MTTEIEDAIESLEILKIFDAPELARAVKMAAAALRAQHTPLDRSRWEGCPMCTAELNPEGCKGAGIYDFRIKDAAMYYHDIQLGWEGINVNYCPFCGRPFTEEAWAELERRIKE